MEEVMKTLVRNIVLSACAVVLVSAPLRASGSAKAGAAKNGANSPAVATPPLADGARMDGGVTGPDAAGSPTGPGMRGMQNSCGDSAWGRRGPDADATAKMKKAEEAEKKAVALGAKVRDAAPAAQAAAKAELRQAVAELFDARVAVAEAHAAAAADRAAELKARVEKKKTLREVFIEKRTEDLSGDGDDDWY
ncbi:MAG: hypothetical protein ACHQ51_12155 [Elusimicrobiota bacterium]